MAQQFNVRLPELTLDQIAHISDTHGLTKTQVIILAVDRFTAALAGEGEPAEKSIRRLKTVRRIAPHIDLGQDGDIGNTVQGSGRGRSQPNIPGVEFVRCKRAHLFGTGPENPPDHDLQTFVFKKSFIDGDKCGQMVQIALQVAETDCIAVRPVL